MTQSPVALVTGASGAVGRATAILLARAGYTLLLTGRSTDQLAEVRRVIEDENPTATVASIPADLTDPDAPARLVDTAVKQFGRLDVLVHVAGDAPLMPIEQNTSAAWRRCMDTNVTALILLTTAAWPMFCRQKRGCVAAVSSMASLDPFPGFSLYAPAKAAMNMFIHCVGTEGAAHGVRAVAIAPGAIETPMLRRLFDHAAIPPDQTLDPMDVARLLVDCITGNRTFESGQTVPQPSP